MERQNHHHTLFYCTRHHAVDLSTSNGVSEANLHDFFQHTIKIVHIVHLASMISLIMDYSVYRLHAHVQQASSMHIKPYQSHFCYMKNVWKFCTSIISYITCCPAVPLCPLIMSTSPSHCLLVGACSIVGKQFQIKLALIYTRTSIDGFSKLHQ